MPLTEAEELELLELEEEEYQDSLRLANTNKELDTSTVEPEKDDGYFSGINKAMYDKAEEYAPKLLKDEKYPLQHAVQKFNAFVDIPLTGLGKAAEPITKPLTKVLKPLAKGVLEGAAYAGGARKANFDNSTAALGEAITPVIKKYDEIKKQYPLVETAGEFVGDVGQLAGNVTGIGAAAKLSTMAGKELVKAPLRTGLKLEEAGKGFKLGDLKIKDTIAKKGYGKDLIEKKQNIANTIYDYGLTKGGNKGGAERAAQLSQEIFDRVDGIVLDIAADPSSSKVNPVKSLLKGIDVKKAPAGKRKQAQSIIDGIVEDLTVEGLDQDHTIDMLIQAKRSLDPDGNLFKNGPGSTTDDILDRGIRKKMYLNLVEEIGNVSPDIKALNTEAKKLIDAEAALAAAASRVANRDAISLTDWVLGAGTLANPSALPLLAVKKGLAGGRGGDLVLNTARSLKGDKVKTIDDILASVKKPESMGSHTIADLPKDWNIPTYQRKGITPETRSAAHRYLPYQKLGELDQPISNMEIPVGAKIRNLGESGARQFDKPIVERLGLPSPEDVNKQYPHLSKENIRNPIAQFDDRKALPAPMVGDALQKIERQIPTMGQRLERVGTQIKMFDKPTSSDIPISADIENFLSNKGLIEEALERMKNIPKSNLSKDQLERMKDIADYLTKNTGKASK